VAEAAPLDRDEQGYVVIIALHIDEISRLSMLDSMSANGYNARIAFVSYVNVHKMRIKAT
jgi:hypothetical protein